MVSKKPEADAEQQSSNDEEPDRSWRLGIDDARPVCLVRSHPWPDGVGDVVAPVRDRHHDRREDLAVRPHVLDSDVIAVSTSVDLAEGGRVMGHDVNGHAVQEPELEVTPPFEWVGPDV